MAIEILKTSWQSIKPPLGSRPNRGHPRYLGCICHWLMNEGGGASLYDISGYCHHGTFAAATATPSWDTGRFGPAVNFDGGDYVSTPSTALLRPTTISLAAWINANTSSNTHGKVICHPYRTSGWSDPYISYSLARSQASTSAAFSLNIGGYRECISISAVFGQGLMHVVGTYDGETMLIYVNGELDNNNTVPSGPIIYDASNPAIVSGQRSTTSTGEFFAGLTHDIRIYNRALAPDEVLSLYQNPFLEFERPQRFWFMPPSGATLVPVDQTTETDLAQSITSLKIVAIGQVTESDSVQAIAPLRTYTVDQISESDFAQALTSLKTIGIAATSETDEAQAIGNDPQARLVGQASETDLAQQTAALKTVDLGQTQETDLAQGITINPQARLIGLAAETDLAQSLASAKNLAIALATESDEAQTISWPPTRLVTAAEETDLAQSISFAGQKIISVDLVSETDLAQAMAPNPLRRLLGQVTENDLAQAMASLKEKALAQVLESDSAAALGKAKRKSIDQITEADLAQAILALRVLAVAQVTESDLAQPFTWAPKIRTLSQVTEIDLAQAIAIKITGRVATILCADVAIRPALAGVVTTAPALAGVVTTAPALAGVVTMKGTC